jgi:hypothetical protein
MSSKADDPALSADAKRRRGATKARATVQRHKDEARVEKLDDIQRQIGAGRLVVRKMNATEQKAASAAARRRVAQVESDSVRRNGRGYRTGNRA